MASEVDQLIKNYREHVSVPWQASLSGSERVWFLVYRPETERRIMFRLQDFESATVNAGHRWVPVDLTARYAQWLGSQRNAPTLLENPDGGALDQFVLDLIEELTPVVAAAGPNDVVVLTSTIALFGVASLSALIKGIDPVLGLEKHVKGRLLVMFPGSRENNTYQFLETGDGWNYMAVPITASSAMV